MHIEIQKVSLGRSWAWMTEGGRLIFAAPMSWFLVMIVVVLLTLLVGMVPFLGMVLPTLLFPVLAAGMMLAAHMQTELRSSFPFDVVFRGFRQEFGVINLLSLGGVGVGVTLLGWALAIAAFALVAGASSVGDLVAAINQLENQQQPTFTNFNVFWLLWGITAALMVYLAVVLLYMMAYWFAPALVVLAEQSPLDALKLGFLGILRNIGTFILYHVFLSVVLLLALMPFVLAGMFFAIQAATALNHASGGNAEGLSVAGLAVLFAFLVSGVLLLFFFLILTTSTYVSFREVFLVREGSLKAVS